MAPEITRKVDRVLAPRGYADLPRAERDGLVDARTVYEHRPRLVHVVCVNLELLQAVPLSVDSTSAGRRGEVQWRARSRPHVRVCRRVFQRNPKEERPLSRIFSAPGSRTISDVHRFPSAKKRHHERGTVELFAGGPRSV